MNGNHMFAWSRPQLKEERETDQKQPDSDEGDG